MQPIIIKNTHVAGKQKLRNLFSVIIVSVAAQQNVKDTEVAEQ
jgi:hypothetical protein